MTSDIYCSWSQIERYSVIIYYICYLLFMILIGQTFCDNIYDISYLLIMISNWKKHSVIIYDMWHLSIFFVLYPSVIIYDIRHLLLIHSDNGNESVSSEPFFWFVVYCPCCHRLYFNSLTNLIGKMIANMKYALFCVLVLSCIETGK